MAAALRCYHLTTLLQPGNDHSDARQQLARELNALADNLPTTAADCQPLVIPRESANSAILQEIAGFWRGWRAAKPSRCRGAKWKKRRYFCRTRGPIPPICTLP
jgi:hypothetical protein